MKLKIVFAFGILSLGLLANAQYVEKAVLVDYKNISTEEAFIYYSLPKTVIGATVFYSQINEKSGPYSQFAEELLGITDIVKTNRTYWRIDSVKVSNFTVPDKKQLVGIKPGKKFEMRFLQPIADAGFILSPQAIGFKQATTDNYIGDKQNIISEILRKPIIRPTTDTTFRTVIRDSVTHRLPIIKSVTAAVSLRDRAKEAAQDIFKLRQRQYEIILGEDEPHTNKKMFNAQLNALAEMEKSYLMLFIGQTTTTSCQVTFYYTPSDDLTTDASATLFWFDEINGFSGKKGKAIKLSMNIEKENNATQVLPQGKNVVYYKIPVNVDFSIVDNDKTYFKGQIPVYQFGKIMPFIVVP
ncbi:MAG TPA: DUF4831 family protein [Bacteroidales bacterium]